MLEQCEALQFADWGSFPIGWWFGWTFWTACFSSMAQAQGVSISGSNREFGKQYGYYDMFLMHNENIISRNMFEINMVLKSVAVNHFLTCSPR